jgi:membrane-associated protein
LIVKSEILNQMKQNFFNFIRLISVPLILITFYLLVYVLSDLFGLPSGDNFIGIVKSAFEKYGLWIVFLSALVEGFLLLGQYFPGGTIIFLGVISAGKNVSRAVEVVSVASLAFIIAYSLNYLVGKYGWYKLLVKFGLGKSLEESKQKLEKQGLNAVIFSYWEPNLASLTATAAGILDLPMRKFQVYSALGVVLWNIFWGVLVFTLGNSALEIIGLKYVLIVFVVWVGIILAKSYWRNFKSKP